MIKGLAFGLILLLIGPGVIPIQAQDTVSPSLPILNGNWFYVGGIGPGNYSKIQDAIDNASDGDIVFVYNGTYEEYLIINKTISLLGEDKNTTIIIGYFAYTISFLIDGAYMSGFTILNNSQRGEGIRIDSSYNTFTNNIVDIPYDRIRLFGHNNVFAGNTIKNTYLYISGDNNSISDNSFTNEYFSPLSNDYHGIYLMDCWNNIITNNSFFTSGVFISLENFCNNIVVNNTVNGKPLVYCFNQSNEVIKDEAGQVILVNCTNITIQDQQIYNTSVGIQIVESYSCVLTSNTITDNHYGVCLNGWNNTVWNNTISSNYYGIDLSGDNTTIFNNILGNNRDGIYFDYSADYNTMTINLIINNHNSILLDYGSDFNNFFNNTITNNKDAILISGDRNTIAGNHISYTNDTGILVFHSDYINVIDNTITNNSGIGILLESSNFDTIIGNIVKNNIDSGIDIIGDNATITDNYIANHIYNGISLDGDNALVSDNTITNNSLAGFYLRGNHNTVSANNITFNNNGIYADKNGFNTFIENNISGNNWSGIYLNSSTNNVISGNSISKNRKGLTIVLSTNNTIDKNNFLWNKRHALFENCTNSWNQNYWGRPHLLPKIIFGKRITQDGWLKPLFDIDWRPALKP